MKIPFSRTIQNWIQIQQLKNCGWVFSDATRRMIVDEMKSWKTFYLPISVRGLKVLDVGAGEGETARFFLDHGASAVICIESDTRKYRNLRLNAVDHDIIALNKRFQLSDLNGGYDFVKIDIEGYEVDLLNDVELKVPCVVELHGLWLINMFKELGYRVVSDRSYFGYAYWDC